MKAAICGYTTNIVDPTTEGQGTSESNSMQKILRSPGAMKKKIISKTFGIPLKELARGPTGVRVPTFIKKICEFIQMHGIGHEGIFRINGSTRVVDKMKASIDKMGNTDLEEAGDVMAVASLLKMYLRELPDPVMTEALHHKFINTQLVHQSNPDECVKQLKSLIQKLPEEHYIVLQYLIRFLVKVSQYETTNKMNSMALAIIFGPNLFRCSAGLDGLREQGITNTIVRTMIDEYDAFFRSEEKEEASPPPLYPSPSKCIQVRAATSKKSPPVKPMPYQEYIRQKESRQKKDGDDVHDFNSNSFADKDREELRKGDETRDCDADGLLSPRDVAGVEERAFSPFNLDSETGTSTAPSPIINETTSELVEKTIEETVSQHLFGQSPSPDIEETLTSPTPEDAVPVPSPRRRKSKKQEPDMNRELDGSMESADCQMPYTEEIYPSVQHRIKSFSPSFKKDSKSPDTSPKGQQKRGKPSSRTDVFETQGIGTGHGPKASALGRRSQSNTSAIPQMIDHPRHDKTNSHGSPSRTKAPEPPSRPSRTKTQLLKSKGHDQRSSESWSPGSGSPRSKSPRTNSPRSSSPRSNSPRSHSPRSNSPRSSSSRSSSPTCKSYTSKSELSKSRSPRSKSPSTQASKPMSLRRPSVEEKPSNPSDLQMRTIYADFDNLSSNSPTLKSLTAGRIGPPRTRRSPSKRKGRSSESNHDMPVDDTTRPFIEQLSILIPETQPIGLFNDVSATRNAHMDMPQPKPRKKHQTRSTEDVSEQSQADGWDDVSMGRSHAAKSPPRSPQLREQSVPPLNFTSLHEHTDGEEPIPAWKARHHFHDGNQEAMLSPRSLKLQAVTHVSHDTDVPPSPPSSQSLLMGVSKRTEKLSDENEAINVKQLSKQIRLFKRKIQQYEEDFEDEYGYKPSHSQKTSQPQIKKIMGDLKKACKQLKEVKENAAKSKVPLTNTLPIKGSSGRNLAKQFEEATVMTSLEIALREAEARLQEKREEAERPEEFSMMSKEQVQEEKTALQKALLQMENRFGRPSTKEAKELMKPLYDRYRNIKKLLVRLELRQADDGPLDLQTIQEHEETKEFQPKQMMHNVYGVGEEEEEEMQTTDFTVTQDIQGVLGTVDLEAAYPSPAESRQSSSGAREEPTAVEVACNLHEASLSELLAWRNQSNDDKRRLRKVLKEFEDNFLKDTGRCVQKEDRVPMETQYNEYKLVKKHLKLLEALVAKHRIQATSSPAEDMLSVDL